MPIIVPPWRVIANKETGTRERGENRGPDIRRYIAGAHCGSEGDPWCAIFQNFTLEMAGIPGTRSPAARSFEHHPNFVQLAGPALGAIVTFWRGIRSQGKGHVGTYDSEKGDLIWVHGGNEGDMVQTEPFARAKPGWGLVGYWWPKHDAKGNPVPLPGRIGPIIRQPGHASAGSGKVT